MKSLADLYEPEGEDEESPPSSKKEAAAAAELAPMVKAFWQACQKGDFKKAAVVMAEMHMACDEYMNGEDEAETKIEIEV